MYTLRAALSIAAIALATAWGSRAFADVAPPDQCSGGPGAACNNAGPAFDKPGTCVSTTCPHTGPGADGGLVTTQNPCVLCQEPATTPKSGCTFGGVPGGVPGDGAIAAVMVGLGLVVARRRRH